MPEDSHRIGEAAQATSLGYQRRPDALNVHRSRPDEAILMAGLPAAPDRGISKA